VAIPSPVLAVADSVAVHCTFGRSESGEEQRRNREKPTRCWR
jgi:hypothetical protein